MKMKIYKNWLQRHFSLSCLWYFFIHQSTWHSKMSLLLKRFGLNDKTNMPYQGPMIPWFSSNFYILSFWFYNYSERGQERYINHGFSLVGTCNFVVKKNYNKLRNCTLLNVRLSYMYSNIFEAIFQYPKRWGCLTWQNC
jgi:hypothetical protein